MAKNTLNIQAELDQIERENEKSRQEQERRDKRKLEILSSALVESLNEAVFHAKTLDEVSSDAKKLVRQLVRACGLNDTKTQSPRKTSEEKSEFVKSFVEGLDGKEFTIPELEEDARSKGFEFTGSAAIYFQTPLEEFAMNTGKKDGVKNIWKSK